MRILELVELHRPAEDVGCGLAMLNAEEEPETHCRLPFQLWAGLL